MRLHSRSGRPIDYMDVDLAFFQTTNGMFFGRDCVSGLRTDTSKFKNAETTPGIFYDHSDMKLEAYRGKLIMGKILKIINMWNLDIYF